MKNLLKNKKLLLISAAVVILAGILLSWLFNRARTVNLDRNAGLNPKDNTVILEIANLPTREVYIENNSKTALGSIPKLFIYGDTGEKKDITEDLPVAGSSNNGNTVYIDEDEEEGYEEYEDEVGVRIVPIETYNSSAKKEFIAFEYQDKDVSSLITVSPALRGTWTAHGGKELVFTPEKDWLPEQKYTVTVSKELISPELKVKSNKLNFTTPKNVITIENLSVQKDATQKKKFDIIAQVKSSYPMDEKKLTKNVKLTLDKKTLTPQITFDQFKRYAFIRYENVNILPKEQVVNLEVKYDGKPVKSTFQVPSESKYFKVNRISALVKKNNDNVPEQLLVVDFSDEVAPSQLKNKIEAYLVKNNTKVTQAVLNTAKRLDLKPLPSNEEGTVHSFKFDFNDEKYQYNIYVKVKPVIVSESGFKLNDEVASTISVPQYPKELSIVGDGSILPLNGDKNLNFVSIGVNKFEVSLARIIPSQINHLISQTYGNIKNPQFMNRYDFNEQNISEIFKKKIALNGDYKTLNYSTLDLKDYLKQGKGLFLVNAEADYNTKDRRLIIISDIGIIYKNLEDDSFKLYALSLSEQKPLANAKVEVLARNGTVIKTVYTNEEGMANIADLSDFEADKYPVAFLVKTANDFNFIPYNREDRRVSYSRFDVYGNSDSQDLDVFAWTDRGLYWPGEKVDFALIAKSRNWTTTAGLPIKIKITNPRGIKIFEKDISLTAEGLSALSYQLNKNSLIGNYQIDIYSIDKENKYTTFINSAYFKVKEYEEDKLKVSSKIKNTKAKGWFTTKETLNVEVAVSNMYGTPAQGNEVKASVEFLPTKFAFKDYKDYVFADTLMENKSLISEETTPLPSQTTDGHGNTTFEIDLNKYSKGTYTMRFYAEALEQESSKSVSTTISAYISPLQYVVGYKTDSNLHFINKNAEAKIDFIALNNNLDKINLKDLTLTVKEQNYISALTRQYDGVYRYQSVLQETEISKQKFDISSKGSAFNLPTDKPGKFSVTLYSDSGEALNKIEYFVAGQNNASFNLERSSDLVMYLEKQTFEPGEEITVNLITPYAGMGLITLESDKVYASKWFKTDTTSSVQKIKIPNTLAGGAYLNISFVRALNSPEIFISPLSYGITYVKITPKQRVLDIDLNTPELIQPGQKLNIGYKTSQPAKIILFGSSEGILQVARYKTPNPLAYFFRKKNLEVRTYQIFDLVLPDFGVIKQFSATGGDTGAEEMAKFAEYQNEFKRNRKEPVTFWSAILNADTTAKTYTYQVPDYFNGNIRVMAVAVNNKGVGSNSKAVNVKSPVILNASAPRMAAPKDIFEVGLRISNENEKLSKGDFSATINTTDGLKVIGDNTQNVTIANEQEKTLYFKVQALENFGNNSINFTVKEKSLKESYKTSYDLSVRPASPYKVNVDMGNALGKKFTIKDFELRDMYAYREGRTLDISQNPLVLFLSLETFLKNYPYGCSEQLTSQVFPRLAYAAAKGKEEKKQVQEELDFVVNKLSLRQIDNGTFSAWDGGFGNDELTMYIADMLLTAKDFGYNIQSNILNRAMMRVKNYVSRVPYSDRQAETMAYGHYLLARNGESQGSYLGSLENYFETNKPSYKKNIEGAYLAAAYKMLQDNSKAQNLIKAYEPINKFAIYEDYDTSLTRNAKYLYLTAKYFPEKLNDKKQKELLQLIIRDIALNNYNTMSASYSMAALSEYAKQSSSADTVFEVSCGKDNLAVKQGEIAEVSQIPLNCKEFKVAANKEAPLGNFWFLKQEGYDKQALKKYSNGMEVYQEFLDDKGQSVKQIKAGDELTVKIKIKSLTGKEITNVAIVNMFAAPFMFVRSSLEGSYTFAEPLEDRLLIFGNYGPETTTLTYKVKVVNSGEFTVPAVIAEAMYNSALSASTDEGKILVEKR